MSAKALYRWGALALMVTATLFALGGIAVLVAPGGGLESPVPALLYYFGTVMAIPALTALYALQRRQAGRLGFVGFALGMLGGILYAGPQLALVAGTSDAAPAWHEIWGFAMGRFPVLTLGGPAFFAGMMLLGAATARSGVLPATAGWLLLGGAALWLVAFILSVIPGLLTIASLVTAAGLAWAGITLWVGTRAAEPRFEAA